MHMYVCNIQMYKCLYMLPHLVHLFEDDPNVLYISLHRWLSIQYIYIYICM